jgi:hypothetical protein
MARESAEEARFAGGGIVFVGEGGVGETFKVELPRLERRVS